MATVMKKCDCAANAPKGAEGRPQRMKKWHKCPHQWKVIWRPLGGSGQKTLSFEEWSAAAQKKKEIEAQQAAGKVVQAGDGRVKFETYAEERLDKWRGAPASAKTYRSSLRRHAYQRIGHLALRDVTREHIVDLIADMEAATDEHGDQLHAPSTIAGVYVAIAAIFAEARNNRRVVESPCMRVELPAVVSGAILIDPPKDQLLTFLGRFPADWRLPSWFQYGCGLRIGEALALNASQFVEGGTMYRVAEQVDPDGNVIPCKWRKKGEYREVPVPEFVQQKYAEHVALFPPDEDGYVIPGRKHARVVRNSYNAHFRKAVELAGLPDFMTSHYLRHRWASVMLARGVDITHVSRWLGHRQIETTYRIYGHMVPRVAGEARVAMQAAFEELPGTEEGTGVAGALPVGGVVGV
ncbi:site-specific integrase [Nocardiopsis sp. FR26]|uniref:tyrosine-type recombinase/integrase n=1 Tax=Nocardiopsis sp. FR26 TaxID=2605987 RepID=UPI001356B40B|nr:site-specific integrase [Nocardiopsis sp. FR26]